MEKNDSGFPVRIIQNSNVTPGLDRAIRDGLVECYPDDRFDFSRSRIWHSEPEWIVIALTTDGTAAAHISIVERRVTVGPESIPVKVAGVQCVFVRPQWRKTGLFDRIMDAALDESRNRGLEAGLLFCLPVLEKKVYGRSGWKKIDVEVLMENDSGAKVPLPDKNIVMAIPLTIGEFPAGNIDLQGQDW